MKFLLVNKLPDCVIVRVLIRHDFIQKGFLHSSLCEFSDILSGLPVGQNSSYVHIYMVFILC